jgi:probable phosphoglycerate mutase
MHTPAAHAAEHTRLIARRAPPPLRPPSFRFQLEGDPFDALFVSPLRRARQTAACVWGGRAGAAAVLPALREVDLYSLQGVFKAEASERPGAAAALAAWRADPAAFALDGHAPVRELWHRASRAWRDVLTAGAHDNDNGDHDDAAAQGAPPRATLLVRSRAPAACAACGTVR